MKGILILINTEIYISNYVIIIILNNNNHNNNSICHSLDTGRKTTAQCVRETAKQRSVLNKR
jgi:hypothetical protein